MSIFGKKPSGQGSDGDASKHSNLDVPNFDKYVYQSNVTRAPQTPASESPMVQKAPPPTMTQAPSMAPSMTQAPVSQTSMTKAAPQERSMGNTSAPSYTIDDVVRLMRDLPDSKKEMVVIIVQKTLMSAKIDVGAIIEDAGRKVDRLQSGNNRLISEIRELEEVIIQKKAEVERVMKELEETTSVKQVFEATYGRHVKGDEPSSGAVQIKF